MWRAVRRITVPTDKRRNSASDDDIIIKLKQRHLQRLSFELSATAKTLKTELHNVTTLYWLQKDTCLIFVMLSACSYCGEGDLDYNQARSLLSTLPGQYRYHVCAFQHESSGFQTCLRLHLRTPEAAKEWWQQFQVVSQTTMRIGRTFPDTGRKNLYKCQYRCQHLTRTKDPKRISKNTNCGASAIITVKRVVQNSRSKDCHLPLLPTVVVLNFTHNHSVRGAGIPHHQIQQQEMISKYEKMFGDGHGPKSAREIHRYDLVQAVGMGEGSGDSGSNLIPDEVWCSRVYRNSTTVRGRDNLTLEGITKCYYPNVVKPVLSQASSPEGGSIVTFCSPFMQRVSESIRQSWETVFIYSKKTEAFKLYFFLTVNSVGFLPIAFMITDSPQTFYAGLQMMQKLLGGYSFHGKGKQGPNAFFYSDESCVEEAILRNFYPQTKVLDNPLIIMQDFWQWATDPENKVTTEDRGDLLYLLQRVLWANSREAYTSRLNKLTNDASSAGYTNFIQYVKQVHQGYIYPWGEATFPKWSLSFSGVDFCVGITQGILIDPAQFSVMQLVDFIAGRLDRYYRDSILKQLQVTPTSGTSHSLTGVTKISRGEFVVMSQNGSGEKYFLNNAIGMCSCKVGVKGAGCKHFIDLAKYLPTSLPHMTLRHKQQLRYVVNGYHSEVTAQPTMMLVPSQKGPTPMVPLMVPSGTVIPFNIPVNVSLKVPIRPLKRSSSEMGPSGEGMHKKCNNEGTLLHTEIVEVTLEGDTLHNLQGHDGEGVLDTEDGMVDSYFSPATNNIE